MSARVVVVGAGIMGLSIAYHLVRDHGWTNITVVDKGYLCSGASGRNGGGVRAQFSSETNIELMQRSLRMCASFTRELGVHVWFRKSGYLFLVRTSERLASLEQSTAVQNRLGLGTRLLSPSEARRLVPELSLEGVVGASFNENDAVVFPWPFVWGYADAITRAGGKILPFTPVTGMDASGSKIHTVHTHAGKLDADVVVNGAGAWSPEIARMVGVELPNHAHRHEICSTESLKPWLGPLVADLSTGLYFSQSTRGEIVGGISSPGAPTGLNMESSWQFLARYAAALTEVCPVLRDVRVLRQWAGCYDLTPDQNPIVGPVEGLDNFFQASGFMGHGFMMAPVMGREIAKQIVTGETSPQLQRWNLRRFREGNLLSESMIIG